MLKLFQNLAAFMSNLAQDKWNHVYVGIPIYGFLILLFTTESFFKWVNIFYAKDINVGFILASIWTTIIACCWELYQKKSGKGVADWRDIIATSAIPWGITIVKLFVSAIYLIIIILKMK